MITVYSKTTGKQQRIPEHWWGHPVLGRDFRKTPPHDAGDSKKTARAESSRSADHKEKK